MVQVQAEGVEYVYLFPDDKIPSAFNQVPVQNPYDRQADVLELVKQGKDTRLVLDVFRKHELLIAVVLYWNDQSNLTLLDEHIRAGFYKDEDFNYAVKTDCVDIRCLNCQTIWLALVMDLGAPYLGAPGLLNRKIGYSKFVNCSNCGAIFKQHAVVKILIPYQIG